MVFKERKNQAHSIHYPITLRVSLLALGQTPDTKIEGKTQDEVAIRKLMEDLAGAWNKHDGVSFAMLFTEDADFTNWRATTRLHGREEINKMNANLATGMFRQSTLTLTGAHVRFFAPDIAAVHWRVVRSPGRQAWVKQLRAVRGAECGSPKRFSLSLLPASPQPRFRPLSADRPR